MGKTLYLECASGISGDMLVAALLDLGADRQVLLDALGRLPLEGYRTRISRVSKAGIDACDFAVLLDGPYENHDHDMGYLYGSHDRPHVHGSDAVHGSAHVHGAGAVHAHRTLADVQAVIRGAALSTGAQRIALRAFEILAAAEAKAHGTTPDLVHFHEVGAVDSIVDIVAAAVCLDDLGADEVIVPALHEGRGTVRCAHGVLPVPVPAVLEIARAHAIALAPLDAEGEYVTPTGAALAAAVRTSAQLPASFTVVSAGYGAGKREHAIPGLLRAMLIEPSVQLPDSAVCFAQDAAEPFVWKLEADIDDCSGEALGYALDCLFSAGAREAHFAPIFMKKNRPAYQIQVICDESRISELESIIFRETTTIGIRRTPMQRTVLPRRMDAVQTPFGRVDVKRVELPDGTHRAYPEYDCVAAYARERGVAYGQVYRAACEAADPDIQP